MKTILLLAIGTLALLTSSCLTMYPVDPMTNEPSESMMPAKVAGDQKSDACAKSASKCTCSKGCTKVCEGKSCK